MAAELFVPGRDAPIALNLVHTPEGDIRPTLLKNKTEGVSLFSYKDEFFLDVGGQRYRRHSADNDSLFARLR
jgi:hypothetical protein